MIFNKSKKLNTTVDEKQIVKIPLEQIKPYPQNARVHTEEQVKRLARSINDYGFRGAILVHQIEDMYEIVAGHGRFLAVQELGHEDIYCEVITNLDEHEIKAMRLADNSVASTEWDLETYKEEYNALQEQIDMSQYISNDLYDEMFKVFEDQIEAIDKESESKQIKFTVTCEDEQAREKALKALFKISGVNID